MQLWLTPGERDNVAQWKGSVVDNTLSGRLLRPWARLACTFVPGDVAPNVITLGSLLAAMHAWLVTFFALVMIFIHETLENMDGIHAKRIGNESPLGGLFNHVCTTISATFQMMALCMVIGGGMEEPEVMWLMVQMAQMGVLLIHLKALESGTLKFQFGTGPSEITTLVMILMALRAAIGLDWLWNAFEIAITEYAAPFAMKFGFDLLGSRRDTRDILGAGMFALYAIFATSTLIRIIRMPRSHQSTRNGLVFCVLYRIAPAILIWYGWLPKGFSQLDVVCSGLFMSVIVSDIVLARMAQRQLHPWVVIFAMASLFDNFLIIVLVAAYWISVFWDIAEYMNLPMLSVYRNVYMDGVYDLCHIGHKRMFRAAHHFGNRLLVGVISDKDAAPYKRQPIMSMEERMAEVAACAGVYKVIPDAPCWGIPEEFIRFHNIHVVAHGAEYDKADDKYYAVPRRMGIARVLPRQSLTMSTSELIRRIKEGGR